MTTKQASKLDLKKIKFLRVKVNKFNTEDLSEFEDTAHKRFSFDIKVKGKYNIDKKYFFIINEIDIYLIINEERNFAGTLHTECIYHIANLEELSTQKEDGKYKFDKTLYHTLVGLAYSTSRGILVAKGAGTLLERAYLPVVKPVDLVKKKS